MDLIIDTSNANFQVSGNFEPRLDKDKVQRRDRSGGTNLPLWAAKVVAWTSSRSSTNSGGTSLGTPGMTADVPSTWASSNMTSIDSKLSEGPFRKPAISLLACIRFHKLITYNLIHLFVISKRHKMAYFIP